MTGKKLQDLTRITSTQGTYLIPVCDDPSGNGPLKAITVTNLGVSGGSGGSSGGNSSGLVTSVAGRSGDVTLTKTDVGLSNVENTALSTWSGSTNINTLGQLASLNVVNRISGGLLSGNTIAGGNGYLNTLTVANQASGNAFYGANFFATSRISGTLISGNTIAGGNGYLNTLTVANQISGQSYYGNGSNLTGLSGAIVSFTDGRYAQIYMPISGILGTTYSLVSGDAGQYMIAYNDSPTTVTVTKQATVPWSSLTELFIMQASGGVVTLNPDTGVTLLSPGGLVTSGSGTVLSLKRIDTNTWTVGTPGKQGATGATGAAGATNKQIMFVFDGNGSVIPSGTVSPPVPYLFGATIAGVYMYGSTKTGTAVTGSAVVDVWKTAYNDSAVPLVANSIVGSAIPTITNKVSSKNSTLTGWTTSITAEDQIVFRVDACTTFTWLSIILKLS